jgi:hypothetical protein
MGYKYSEKYREDAKKYYHAKKNDPVKWARHLELAKKRLAAFRKKYPERHKEYYRRAAHKPTKRFSSAKSLARRNGREFTFTYPEYLAIVSTPCVYCHGDTGHGCGLDRIDNAKGYTHDNVLSCCGDCNRMRGARLTVAETHLLIAILYAARGAESGKLWT